MGKLLSAKKEILFMCDDLIKICTQNYLTKISSIIRGARFTYEKLFETDNNELKNELNVQVAHSIRELIDVFGGLRQNGENLKIEIEDLIKKLYENWEEDFIDYKITSGSELFSRESYSALKKHIQEYNRYVGLIKEQKGKRIDKLENAILLHSITQLSEGQINGLGKRLHDLYKNTTKLSHHGIDEIDTEIVEAYFSEALQLFLSIFTDKLTHRFQFLKTEIIEIEKSFNADCAIKTKDRRTSLINSIKGEKEIAFFFKQISHPKWFPSLQNASEYFFLMPIKLGVNKQLYWFFGKYILQYLESRTDEIDSIKKFLKAAKDSIIESKNYQAIGDYLLICKKCGLRVGTQDIIQILSFLKNKAYSENFIFIQKELKNIISEDSFDFKEINNVFFEFLTLTLGEYQLIPKHTTKEVWDFLFNDLLVPKASVDSFYFKKIVELCDTAINLKNEESGYDRSSQRWFPYFDEPERIREIEDYLLLGIINILKRVETKQQIETIWNDLNELRKRSENDFVDRLKIWFYSKHLNLIDSPVFTIEEHIEFVTKPQYWHEYSIFLQQHFSMFCKKDQKILISAKREYDLSVAKQKNRWFWFLQVIKEYLETDFPEYIIELVKWKGEQVDDDRNPLKPRKPRSYSGSIAPKEIVLNFEDKSPEEIINQIKSWKPNSRWNGPDPRGLERFLENELPKRIVEFIPHFEKFKVLHPTYVNGLFGAIRTSKNRACNKALLELAEWVLIQKDTDAPLFEGIDSFSADPDWQWTRSKIASTMEVYLSESIFEIENFDSVLNVLNLLLGDSNPTYVEEQSQINRNGLSIDAYSINTVRGKAIYSLLYALIWAKKINNNLEKHELISSKVVSHFESDSSLVCRYVYAWFYRYLYFNERDISNQIEAKLFFDFNKERAYELATSLNGLTWNSDLENLINESQGIQTAIITYLKAQEEAKPKVNEDEWIIPTLDDKKRNWFDINLKSSSIAVILWRGILYLDWKFEPGSFLKDVLTINQDKISFSFLYRFKEVAESSSELFTEDINQVLYSIWQYFNEVELSFEDQKKTKFPGRTILAEFGLWFHWNGVLDDKRKLSLLKETVKKNGYLKEEKNVFIELKRLFDKNENCEDICDIITSWRITERTYFYPEQIIVLKEILQNIELKPEFRLRVAEFKENLVRNNFTEFI